MPLGAICLSSLWSYPSTETSAQWQETYVVLCHWAILNGTLCLCHFYEVSAWHRSLKRKPTQSYFCNWRWARMGIVKWDYYLWNEQWKRSLFLPITKCAHLQRSVGVPISTVDHYNPTVADAILSGPSKLRVVYLLKFFAWPVPWTQRANLLFLFWQSKCSVKTTLFNRERGWWGASWWLPSLFQSGFRG